MNICIVSLGYMNKSGKSGLGTYAHNMVSGLSELGHEVHVIARTGNNDTIHMKKNVYIHGTKQKRIRGSWRFEKYLPIDRILCSISLAKKIQEIVQKYYIDIVEIPNTYGQGYWYARSRRKIPIVTRMHTAYFLALDANNKRYNLADRIACFMEKKAIVKSDGRTCSTLNHMQNMANICKINKERIAFIPLGVSKNKNNEDSAQYKSKGFKILFVGKLEKNKGIEDLLNIAPKLIDNFSDIYIYLVGADWQNTYYDWFIKKIGKKYLSNVIFLGLLEDNEMYKHYETCDIFVGPSHYESFGLVYLEAMLYKKPVVACNVGGVPDIVQNGETGFLIDAGNLEALFDRITCLYENKNMRVDMGMAGYAKAKEYSIEKMITQTERYFNTVREEYDYKKMQDK